MGNKGSFPDGKATWREADYPPYHLVPGLRKSGATTSLNHTLSKSRLEQPNFTIWGHLTSPFQTKSDERISLWTGNFLTSSMESEQVGSIEVQSSNFWRDIHYPDWNCSWFFAVPPSKVADSVLNLAQSYFFHILSNSPFITMQSLDRAQSWVVYIFIR